jgi:hypothetical protein
MFEGKIIMDPFSNVSQSSEIAPFMVIDSKALVLPNTAFRCFQYSTKRVAAA